MDIQTSTAAVLQKAFGLNSSTAANMVSARPYQLLPQINPDRVPGLGTSSQALVLKNGCLTPATIITDTATWRWAYPDTTTTDQRAKFALTVPAGTITSGVGAWLSVTNASSPTLVQGPTADFHIWGTWANPAGASVQLTGPAAPLPDGATGEWDDAVIHYASDGAVFYGPGATTVNASAGTVTISVDSLSVSTWIKAPLTFLGVAAKAVFTGSEFVQALVRWFLGLRADRPECAPDVTTDFPTIQTYGSALNPVLGDFNTVPVKYCVESAPVIGTQKATWKIVNNLGTVLRIYSPAAQLIDRIQSGDALTDLRFRDYQTTTAIDIPPGGGGLFKLTQGDPPAPVAVTLADSGFIREALVARSLSRVLGLGGGGLARVDQVYSIFNDCAYNFGMTNLGQILPFVKCMATAALSFLPEAASRVLTLASVAFDVWIGNYDALNVGVEPRDLTLTFLAPPPPSQPTDGNIGGSTGSTGPANGAMLILKRINSNASYLLDSNGVAHPIPDGGTYICLAKYWPVRYNLDDNTFSSLATSMGDDASCPPPVGAVRQLTGATAKGFLLRQGNGTAYVVNDNGYRVPLFSGQDNFDCFAANHLVWDWVTDTDVKNIKPDPSIVATGCGSGPIQGG